MPSDPREVSTQLAAWQLHVIGRSLLVAVVLALVIAIIAAAAGQEGVQWWLVLVTPVAFGLQLVACKPPRGGPDDDVV